MRVSPVELNTATMSACIILLRQTVLPSSSSARRFFAKRLEKNSRLHDWHSLPLVRGFPQSQQSVVEKKAWVSTRRTCVFKSAIFPVCSFVASLHCVTQRGLAPLHFIVSCEPIREGVTSMLAMSRVTNQMPRSIWATHGEAVLWAACGIYGLRQFQNCYVVPYFAFKE